MTGWVENQFRVVRNTATLQAYRRHSEAALRAGGAFIFAPAFLTPAFVILLGLWRRSSQVSVQGVMAVTAVWLLFAAACLAFGVWRIGAYRRAHPFEAGPGV